jgi:hypothetical protein
MSVRACAAGATVLGMLLSGTLIEAQRTFRIGIITYAGAPASAEAAASQAGPPMPIKTLLAERGYREGETVVYLYPSAATRPSSIATRKRLSTGSRIS